ncbi:MAG TPA: PAS domain S-box protein [Burkholderiales bacterium]|nr:PAS domain S-box protein [Burkholderiales bacterium]
MEPDSRIAELGAGADPADAQFRLLVETVSDYAIFLLDPEGRIISWNAGAQRIKGYAAVEILGRHFSVFYAPEERAAGRPQELLAVAGREGRIEDEGWRLRKDGSRFWADVVITALRDAAGRVSGYAKVTRDMTELQRHRERVETSEARLRAFADHSPALMFIKDLAGRYRFANRRFLERFGLQLAQLLGRTDAELFPRAQAAAFRANDAEVAASGRPVEVEEKARYVDGEHVSLVVKFPLFDAPGNVSAIGGIATDITERKLTEQALVEQRKLLQEAQNVAGLGCWEWDPASGRITWSEQLYRLYGLDPQRFQPSFEGYLERVHPEDRSQSGERVARALIDGRPFSTEERIVRADGAVRWLRSHCEVVRDAAGRPIKLLGACLDVTESRASEQALRAAAASLQALSRRLVEAEEAERRRIAGELHDRVGQNLSALNINLDIVLGGLGEDGSKELRLRLRDSLALVDGTLQAIENVMAELRPPLLEEYGLGAALGWYAEDFFKRTGIEIDFQDEARERNRELRRDAAVALFRIAQEALNNVAKHANARRVRIAVSASAGEMSVEVRDDGAGFDPLAAEARASRWGMTTMRERAEAAGGRLEISSNPGGGTALRATVPF